MAELVEQLREGFTGAGALLCFAVEWRKGPSVAEFENHLCARKPVETLAMIQVADDVVDGPGVGAFVAMGPGLGEMAK